MYVGAYVCICGDNYKNTVQLIFAIHSVAIQDFHLIPNGGATAEIPSFDSAGLSRPNAFPATNLPKEENAGKIFFAPTSAFSVH